MVLRCAVRDLGIKRIITSAIEHHAVLHAAEAVAEEYGIALELVDIDQQGFIDLKDLENKLSLESAPKTLVSLMHVNNEIGNLLEVEKVAALCKTHQALFHSDTVQSVGHYQWDLSKTPVHFICAAAHKFHGPKGVGFLYMRSDVHLKSLIVGGGQEKGFRAGTESVHNILGMEKAFALAYQNLAEEKGYVLSLKKRFIEGVKTRLPEAILNGGCSNLDRSTYTLVNLRLPITGDKATLLLFHLDLKGIACSQGSACQSGSNTGSHVLRAIAADNFPSLRFSFSIYNTVEEVDYVIDTLASYLA
jgi:cysteine desulfurase